MPGGDAHILLFIAPEELQGCAALNLVKTLHLLQQVGGGRTNQRVSTVSDIHAFGMIIDPDEVRFLGRSGNDHTVLFNNKDTRRGGYF